MAGRPITFKTDPARPVESMVQNAGVGALLRSRREELGQDTESVARQLRIRSLYIRAIEEGRLQDLPGTAYAVGFVRTYADFLGFDGNSVVANYRDELGQRGRPDSVSWQIEDKDGGFPFGRVLVILVVIAIAAYGLWYYLANTQSGSGLIEAVPEYLKKSTGADKTATPASGQSTAPASQPSSGAAAPGSSSQASPAAPSSDSSAASTGITQDSAAAQPANGEVAPASPATASTATPAQTAATQTPATQTLGAQNSAPAGTTAEAAQQPAPAGGGATLPPATQTTASPATTSPVTPSTPPAATGGSGEATPDVAAAATTGTTRISVRAKLESWVQINDKDGKPVLSRVLRAGETFAVPDEKGLVMNTGNAGGIEIVVDGKSLPTLGSVGLVKRNIVLDADKLAAGSVTTKTPGKEPGADGAATPPAGD